jgi:putative GTP pyrophosphokinase
LLTDVEVVERVLTAFGGWVATRERHFEDEIFDDPEVFEYQSVHYLVRSCEEVSFDGRSIPPDTACEVQVRTLLQHAYAEVAHDNIYKSKVHVPASVKRLVARGMALMESTDLIFRDAVAELRSVVRSRGEWLLFLRQLHCDLTGRPVSDFDESESTELLDTYRHLLEGTTTTAVKDTVADASLRSKIRARAPRGLFGDPVCVVVYWLVANHRHEVSHSWPIARYRNDFEQVCADLGVAVAH